MDLLCWRHALNNVHHTILDCTVTLTLLGNISLSRSGGVAGVSIFNGGREGVRAYRGGHGVGSRWVALQHAYSAAYSTKPPSRASAARRGMGSASSGFVFKITRLASGWSHVNSTGSSQAAQAQNAHAPHPTSRPPRPSRNPLASGHKDRRRHTPSFSIPFIAHFLNKRRNYDICG